MRCSHCHSGRMKRAENFGAERMQCGSCGIVTKRAETRLTEKQQEFINYVGMWPTERIETAWEVTQDLDQNGISMAIGISRSNVPRLVEPLIRAGLVRKKKAHILDENNRVKSSKKLVYYLTPEGRKHVTESRRAETFEAEEPFICPECRRASTKSKTSQVCVRCESEYQSGLNPPMRVPWPGDDGYYAETFEAESYKCRSNGKKYQRIGRKPHHTRTLTGEPITYNHRVCMGCGEGCWTNNKVENSAEAEEVDCDWVQIEHGHHPTKMSYIWYCEKLNAQIDSIKKPSRNRKVKPNSFTQNWKGGSQGHNFSQYFGAEEFGAESFSAEKIGGDIKRDLRKRRKTPFYEIERTEEEEDHDQNKYARTNAGGALWEATYQALRDDGMSHTQAETFCNSKFFDHYYESLIGGLRTPMRNLLNRLRKPFAGITRNQRLSNRHARQRVERYSQNQQVIIILTWLRNTSKPTKVATSMISGM